VVITEQRERWEAAGSPPVPTLVVGGVPHVLQHPAQAAELLGLATPPALRDARQVAWDLDALVDAWLELARATPWDVLTAPGVVLDRTPLALAVDALNGVAAVTAALWTGWFHWPGNPETGATGDAEIGPYEASVVASIHDRDGLLAYAGRVANGFHASVLDHDTLLGNPAAPILAVRGELTLVELLEAQRLHCAGHYRQATAAPGVVRTLDVTTLHGLVLADAIA
jgi:hypothetical protein